MNPTDPDWLDRMYNNRALVPDHAQYFARWAAHSARARDMGPCVLDQAYGAGANETLDIFPVDGSGAPVLVFIHGGYWRSLDKADHSFIAPAFTRQGVCVVVPNYALCPGVPTHPVSIADIALQMTEALAWTWRNISDYGGNPSRITVAGHSAGGHLAALLLVCRWAGISADLPANLVRNAMSISGLHDLEPIARAPFLKEALRLTMEDVRRCSPARMPPPTRGVLHAVAGAAESGEFVRQNTLIRNAWGSAAVPVCELAPGRNHFSVLEALCETDHPLHRHAMNLLQA